MLVQMFSNIAKAYRVHMTFSGNHPSPPNEGNLVCSMNTFQLPRRKRTLTIG